MKYIKKENTNRKRKFTDEQFLKLYKSGLSDGDIAKCFGCSSSSVNIRRTRLHLVANFKSFSGKINDSEEKLRKAEKKIMERTSNIQKNEDYKKKAKIWRENNIDWIKKYNKIYVRKPEVKKKNRENLREYRKTEKFYKWKNKYFNNQNTKYNKSKLEDEFNE